MGLLDSIEGMVGGAQGAPASEHGRVAGGFLQSLGEHPGGLGSIMDNFRNQGMDQHVNDWSTGQNQQATPEQVQNGLGGTGILEQTAQRAGVSPEVAKMALATILPMVMAHMTQGGQSAPPSNQGEFGGMAGSLLSRLL
ncbi:MAG: YidB family protein [Janthinobacterium lividum]